MSETTTQNTNTPQTNKKPELPPFPPFPEAEMNNASLSDIVKIGSLINYIDEVKKYLEDVETEIRRREDEINSTGQGDGAERAGGGKKKQRKTKKKGGADIDYSKVYNVQGLIENISKSTGKDPIASQSVPAPFSTGSPLQRFGKKEAKSLPNELKNEIIPDYSQDGGKKKKTEKKKMPKKK